MPHLPGSVQALDPVRWPGNSPFLSLWLRSAQDPALNGFSPAGTGGLLGTAEDVVGGDAEKGGGAGEGLADRAVRELGLVTIFTTGHGISAGVGKLGAFIGVFLFPVLQRSLGLRGTLLLTAVVSGLGCALTLVLPEPAGRSLDEIAAGPPDTAAQPQRVTRPAPAA